MVIVELVFIFGCSKLIAIHGVGHGHMKWDVGKLVILSY